MVWVEGDGGAVPGAAIEIALNGKAADGIQQTLRDTPPEKAQGGRVITNHYMPEEVLQFWFEEIEPASWWKKDPAFDQLIISRFSATHDKAIQGELYGWRQTAGGRLAEIIVLDQFSRNMFRDSPRSFAYDALALVLAQEAIASGVEKDLAPVERTFLYMPFMHSESREIHEVALKLFTDNGLEDNLDFEIKHKNIIDRFGHYPHRNKILGRASTKDELEFLQQPNSSF